MEPKRAPIIGHVAVRLVGVLLVTWGGSEVIPGAAAFCIAAGLSCIIPMPRRAP